mgnify:CR=1 FL=1
MPTTEAPQKDYGQIPTSDKKETARMKKLLRWMFWAFIVLYLGVITFLLAYRIVFD